MIRRPSVYILLMLASMLGLLASFSVYSFNGGPPPRAAITRQSVLMLATAARVFSEGRAGRLPVSMSELVSAGYLAMPTKDGWNRPLVYIPREDGTVVVGSLGADGEAGRTWRGSDDLIWLLRCRRSDGAALDHDDPRWLVPVQNAEFER